MKGLQMNIDCLAVAAALMLPLVAWPVLCLAGESDSGVLSARSLVSPGDLARLQQALAKARRGEPVTVGVIGGSITQGASASSPEKNYGSLVARWWRETFPKSKVQFDNAGIGATGSNFGALRAQRDLLSHKPDFVIAEYGVNDGNSRESAETLEGLVRQALGQPDRPALILMFMMLNNGQNAQEWHGKVGQHYGLPMVSFRDALWPEIEAKRMKWEDVEADVVHPNDRGHAYAAAFVTSLLAQVLKDLPPDGALPEAKPVPKPLLSDLFEHVTLLEAEDLKPVACKGWAFDAASKSWRSDKPGSTVEFDIEGQAVLAMHYRLRGAMGKARVQVDDRPPVVRDGWFDQTWGGYRETWELARGLGPGKHRVRLELLEEKSPESGGHEFRLLGLGVAGTQAAARSKE
jgi:lysophospholipase L1-like esterase